ncbi:MAG: hypothetical protein MUC42_18310, partial [Bryobacter sp.]|nr:hypothetical protein [Bryobacter sp.]
MYAAGGRVQTLEALAKPDKWNLMFLRHRSGPAYLWYEIAHPRFLRKTVDEYGQPGFTNDDVVVDKMEDVAWRLRALHGLRRTQNRRILAIGGGAGWGAGGKKAPQLSLEKFQIRIEDVGYPYLGELIQKAMADPAIVRECKNEAAVYLKQPGVKLETGREFVENAFVLRKIFVDLMRQAGADALTVNNCMSTIMPLAKTTACLTLSLLNDDGYLAFCESDFVVIPSGILLNAISGKPVFLNDPTHPHDGLVTLAHCTAPRKNDGVNADPALLLTHFESDYGAAPKVEMRLGQKLTVIDPDFGFKRWLGFSGEVVANPFLPICRSQIDVGYTADTRKMLEEMRGFHWMSCYGDYRKEVG